MQPGDMAVIVIGSILIGAILMGIGIAIGVFISGDKKIKEDDDNSED